MNKLEKRKSYVLLKVQEANGNITLACRSCGISRDTFYRWLKVDTKFCQNYENIEDDILRKHELLIKQRGLFEKDTRALIYTAERFAGKVKSRQINSALKARFEGKNKRNGRRYG